MPTVSLHQVHTLTDDALAEERLMLKREFAMESSFVSLGSSLVGKCVERWGLTGTLRPKLYAIATLLEGT